MKSLIGFFAIFLFSQIFISGAAAHCDGLDGPVVKAAIKALETGDINHVLIWVKKEYEEEVKASFDKSLSVGKLSPEAKELSDMYFFETVVRLHRLGEGAPYTGLKPAGRDPGPVIPLADKSLDDKNAMELVQLIVEKVRESILKYFHEALEKKNFDVNDLSAGREFVRSYVEFVHFVEKIYEAAVTPAGDHKHETDRSHKE